jgi:DNA modification methylase
MPANKTAKTKYAERGITHYKRDKVGLREKDGSLNGFTMAGQAVNQTKVIDSVIRCQSAKGGVAGHPAPFSVGFAETLIEVYSPDAGNVYEPFAGSGTVFIAADKLGRIAHGIELAPKYCDVIIKRYADYAGVSEDGIRKTREKANG